MYKYVLNSVVKFHSCLPSIFNTTPLYLGGPFFRGHTVLPMTVVYHTYLKQESISRNNTDVKFDYLKYMMLI